MKTFQIMFSTKENDKKQNGIKGWKPNLVSVNRKVQRIE